MTEPTPAPTPPDPELKKEWLRLYRIMYDPHSVALVTSVADCGRWLCDGYVLLDVTGSPAAAGFEDGQYKLTQAHGLARLRWKHPDVNDGQEVPRPPELDPDAAFDTYMLAEAGWVPARPSEWSVAEHPGKAMLFSAAGRARFLGETTWATLKRAFGDVRADYATGLALNMFRVLQAAEGAPEGVVVAYVAGIRCPDGQGEIAAAIARLAENAAG